MGNIEKLRGFIETDKKYLFSIFENIDDLNVLFNEYGSVVVCGNDFIYQDIITEIINQKITFKEFKNPLAVFPLYIKLTDAEYNKLM